MRRLDNVRDAYVGIHEALDHIKAVQAAQTRAGLSKVAVKGLAEARAALDVTALDIESQIKGARDG